MKTDNITPVPQYTEGATWRNLRGELTDSDVALLEQFQATDEDPKDLYYIAVSTVEENRRQAAAEVTYHRATGTPLLGHDRTDWFDPDEQHSHVYREVKLGSPFEARGFDNDRGVLHIDCIVDVEVTSTVGVPRIRVETESFPVELSAVDARAAAHALMAAAELLESGGWR